MCQRTEKQMENKGIWSVVVYDEATGIHKDGDVICTCNTKNEAYSVISYMEEFDYMIGIQPVTYKIIPTAEINEMN